MKKKEEFNLKAFLGSQEYQIRHAALQREINADPLVIDYACFRKTPAEKQQLKLAKKEYKLFG